MDKKFELGFGPHLTLDLYDCNKERLGDLRFIYDLLDQLPELIGMHKISTPQVTYYKGSDDSFDKGGVSGFVLIAESHIAVHSFIEQRHLFVDIFSCKDFDVEYAEKHLTEQFKAKKVDKRLFDRGVEFPKEVTVVADYIGKERKTIKR